MNVTLSLDDDLVKEARKIAVERDTTLTGLIRIYLQGLAAESAENTASDREREALERTFQQFRLNISPRIWTRADIHARS